MASKLPTITFCYRPDSSEASNGKGSYECVKVTDSLSYDPGKFYSKHEVEMLCASRKWKVTVTK